MPLNADVWFMEDELHDVEPPPFLIDEVLPARSVNMFFGESNVGKTFVALDWAACVATGKSWVGRDVLKGDVLYIASEGDPGNLGLRTQAWRDAHGLDFPLDILFYTDVVDLMDNAGELLDEALGRGLRPRLVVIDTLGMAMSESENDNMVMNNLVKALRKQQVRLADEQPELEIAWLLVHHTGWGDDGRPRGGSAMVGGLDSIIGMKNTSYADIYKLFAYKSKNFAKWSDMFFEAEPQSESLVYRYLPAEVARELLGEEAGGKVGTVRDGYSHWESAWDVGIVYSPKQIKEAINAAWDGDGVLLTEAHEKSLSKHLQELVALGKIERVSRGKYRKLEYVDPQGG